MLVNAFHTDYVYRIETRLQSMHNFNHIHSVWTDWTIYVTSCWQIILQKYPEYLVTFWSNFESIPFKVKTAVSTYWETSAKFGQLFNPSSGHTESKFHALGKFNSCFLKASKTCWDECYWGTYVMFGCCKK